MNCSKGVPAENYPERPRVQHSIKITVTGIDKQVHIETSPRRRQLFISKIQGTAFVQKSLLRKRHAAQKQGVKICAPVHKGYAWLQRDMSGFTKCPRYNLLALPQNTFLDSSSDLAQSAFLNSWDVDLHPFFSLKNKPAKGSSESRHLNVCREVIWSPI